MGRVESWLSERVPNDCALRWRFAEYGTWMRPHM